MVFIFILFMFLISIIPISIGLILSSVIYFIGFKLKNKRTKKYAVNCMIAIDQYTNTITGGDPDETISSRTEKAKNNGHLWGKLLSKFLDLFEKNHTKKSLESDEGKNKTIQD